MEIPIRFAGGPMDAETALVDGLDPIRIFFNDEDRRVIYYFRADELLYVFDHVRSVKLSEHYDDVKRKVIESTPPSTLRWQESPDEAPPPPPQPPDID